MKIAIFIKNWLGDTLFQIPAINAIKHKYPDAEIVCISPKRCHAVLECVPAVSRMITFDEKNEHRSWLKRIGFAAVRPQGKLRNLAWFSRHLQGRAFGQGVAVGLHPVLAGLAHDDWRIVRAEAAVIVGESADDLGGRTIRIRVRH